MLNGKVIPGWMPLPDTLNGTDVQETREPGTEVVRLICTDELSQIDSVAGVAMVFGLG